MTYPVVKVRSTDPHYQALHATNLVAVGLSYMIALRFKVKEDALLDALLEHGYATLGPYIFTLV